jgi:uncharacterized protein (TIGR02391 family)
MISGQRKTMARKPAIEKISVSLSAEQVRAAIPKIRRRLEELSSVDLARLDNDAAGHLLDSHVQKINATLREIYGVNSVEYDEYSIETFRPVFMVYYGGMDTSIRGNIDTVRSKIGGGITKLKTLLEILEGQVGGETDDAPSRAIQAFNGLDLHPEISRAASGLYLDGHFSNAVEASVKALNGLVRLRSGLEFDGSTLMERAFNPSTPVLRFNDLLDQSDKDEQKGFMQMFSGAISGLRNPRAHGFIQDDPERALEFIAFVSLLAKLLDEAKR